MTGNSTITWLLDPSEPSLRYRTLRELLDSPDDPEAIATLQSLPESKPIVQLVIGCILMGIAAEESRTVEPSERVWNMAVLGRPILSWHILQNSALIETIHRLHWHPSDISISSSQTEIGMDISLVSMDTTSARFSCLDIETTSEYKEASSFL